MNGGRGRRLLSLDARLSTRMVVAEQPGVLRTIAILLAHSADSWFWLLGLGVVWWSGNMLWKDRAVAFIIGVLSTASVVLVLKFVIQRPRPLGEWGDIYRKTDPHSFPSGHAARSMMLAVMAFGLGPAWFAGILAVWAPLVAIARVAMGVHYLFDIIAGIVIGGVMGFIVLWIHPLL